MKSKFGIVAVAAPLLFTCATKVHAGEDGYYAQPALHGERVVFVSEGDLWTCTIPPAAQGGAQPADSAGVDQPIIAYRLTSSAGDETYPRISPDGSQIAFSGQYDGNTDVYVMPITGGSPRRLTFHSSDDEMIGWTRDGSSIVFSSPRRNPHGEREAFQVSVLRGMPRRYDFGRCTQLSFSLTGRRIAFTPLSNERWMWRGYRGGAVPDIWVGDIASNVFNRLTDGDANDMHPMWLAGRVYFVSDRDGAMNIHSDLPDGGDPQQHTHFAPLASDPAAIEGHAIRWPSGDAQRRGQAIIFCQAGQLAVLNVRDGALRRLNVQLASDRNATRQQHVDVIANASEFALSADGSEIYCVVRGEIIALPVGGGAPRQLTRTSGIREWGLHAFVDGRLGLISDAPGEPQVAMMKTDGSELPSAAILDNTQWIYPPRVSPDGKWIVYANKSGDLNAIDMNMLEVTRLFHSENGEIRDYRISPDSNWVAFTTPQDMALTRVRIHSLRTGRTFEVSDALHGGREPRWDPKGAYLYYLSDRHLEPILDEIDWNAAHVNTTRIIAVPLSSNVPPPFPQMAELVDHDLAEWGAAPDGRGADGDEQGAGDAPRDIEFGALGGEVFPQEEKPGIVVHTEGIASRGHIVPIAPGQVSNLEAHHGGVTFLRNPLNAVITEQDTRSGAGALMRYWFVEQLLTELSSGVEHHVMNASASAVAWRCDDGFRTASLIAGTTTTTRSTLTEASAQLLIDVRQQWSHIFDEAWRMQRDFFWNPNMGGVDWGAMKSKYTALLQRVGTRDELNDLIGQMIGELGASYAFAYGGAARAQSTPINVGLLGADIDFSQGVCTIDHIFAGPAWDDSVISPLGHAFLGVNEGDVLLAINGQPIMVGSNPYALLQGQADRVVRLTISGPDGSNRRDVNVRAIADERPLRYAHWVEANRQAVADATGGAVGYIHVPDMAGGGMAMFTRQFNAQRNASGLIIDVRHYSGGFIGEMILERLARRPLAHLTARHGATQSYPATAARGHTVLLVNEDVGSDGEKFAAMFRAMRLGPVVGTRTWGGVIATRPSGARSMIDGGIVTQPEYAWWEPDGGWTIENRGVAPDVEMVITPQDRALGRDTQLERGISEVLELLRREPVEDHKRPPYPDGG